MQILVEVGIDPAGYVNEQYQCRVRAPSVCPNCGRAQALEAHGYYWRWVTALCGMVIRIAVRRFCCRHCPVTVSCLPQFAQPYRLVCNQTIERFFEGGKDRSDVKRWQELLERYRGRYEGFLAELRAECGRSSGALGRRSKHYGFLGRVIKACGGLAAAAGRIGS